MYTIFLVKLLIYYAFQVSFAQYIAKPIFRIGQICTIRPCKKLLLSFVFVKNVRVHSSAACLTNFFDNFNEKFQLKLLEFRFDVNFPEIETFSFPGGVEPWAQNVANQF